MNELVDFLAEAANAGPGPGIVIAPEIPEIKTADYRWVWWLLLIIGSGIAFYLWWNDYHTGREQV